MNSKNIIAISDTSLCMKCLKNKATHEYNICGRGYGSIYDGEDTRFQLCDNCINPQYDEWVNEICEYDGWYIERYKYERNIQELIDSFPLESQELFHNRFSGHYMLPQDWIDYQLDELKSDKCQEYNVYSPEEKLAYKERFPKCSQVSIIKYEDGSQSSKCPYGACGDEQGNCSPNISDECYMCHHYETRNNEIPTTDEYNEYLKHEEKRLYSMIEYSVKHLKELKGIK